MKLSKRLEMVVSFAGKKDTSQVRDGVYRVADVGTDHGYVPIALALRDPAVQAVAMDIRPGPLGRAEEHIEEYGLRQRIQVRLSDGVEKLEAGEADTVVISGMGGELVIHIMDGGRRLWQSVGRWILSPQSELYKVRKYLEFHGFVIADEEMVEEDGKYYTVIEAVFMEPGSPGQAGTGRQSGEAGPEGQTDRHKTESETGEFPAEAGSWQDERQQELARARYLYGPRLIEKRCPVLQEYLQKEEKLLTGILAGLQGQDSAKSQARREELRKKLSLARAAAEEMAGSQ